jgi:hypothetical protein
LDATGQNVTNDARWRREGGLFGQNILLCDWCDVQAQLNYATRMFECPACNRRMEDREVEAMLERPRTPAPRNTGPNFVVKDSGVRSQFSTGSVRDAREGKGRPELISPIYLRRLAQHCEAGAKKYSPRNWEKGQPLCESYYGSAKRHLESWLEGLNDEDHLSAAAWNIMCLIHTEEMIRRGLLPKELNDRPSYVQNPKP